MCLIIVEEGDPRRLFQVHLHIGTIEISVQAVILRPAAIHRNLVVISPRRQVCRIGIEAIPLRCHTGLHIRWVPILGRASLRLNSSRNNNGPFSHLPGYLLLLSLLPLVGIADLMGRSIIGKRNLMGRLQPQRYITAIERPFGPIIHIPATAHSNLEFIGSRRQFPLELVFSIACRLHDGSAIRRVPVLGRP